MSITRRTFFIVCFIISSILLTLNVTTYVLFHSAITQQLITSQEAVIEANVRLSNIFTQTFDQLVYQYTSDQQLGSLLSRSIGEDPLDDLNIKYGMNNRLAYHLNAESILLNNGFSAELYVNPKLEVSELFQPSNTIPNVSRVFNGESVQNEDWYQQTLLQKTGPYIFLSEDKTELCFSCKLQSSSFQGPYLKDGVGVLLGKLSVAELPHVLSLVPITQNGGFLLLNKKGEQVFQSEHLGNISMQEPLPISDSVSAQITLDGVHYLYSAQDLEWGPLLVFLSPYQDITHQVWAMIFPYLICSVFFFAVGILFSFLLSSGVSRPVVEFSKKIESIQDTRNLHWEQADPKAPREIKQLNASFGALMERVNGLIEEVSTKENMRRESELRALQAQINPHFMLNAMNAVNYMALAREADDIAVTVNSIASLMRYSITEPDRMVTMATELENVDEYISIYVLRFRQNIKLEILPGLSPSQVIIPKFTLQPLIENSIRHGITRQDPGITIRVHAYETQEGMLIDVTDTGMGGDAEKLNAYLDYQDVDLKVTHGFGIRNVNERVKLRFGENSGLRYQNYDGQKLLARLTFAETKENA